MSDSPNITVVDFITVPTQDLDRSVAFFEDVLGLTKSVYMPERGFAEFETGNVTLTLTAFEQMGMEFHRSTNPFALHVDDLPAAKAALEAKGVVFPGDPMDTGVCHMAFFADPDGNPMMLHSRYVPRVTLQD
jgi:predicted enzyme related to lactoylglutathione lyase